MLISRFDMFDYIRVDHFRGFCAYWAVPFGELMDRFGFPGMKVLQFGFDEKEENDHLPHGYVRNSVVYTGTHDNDTVVGWFAKAKKAERALAPRYLASDGKELHSLGPSVVAIEWGSRRRSSVTVELAPGISLVSYSLISGSGPAREEGV